VTGTVQDVDVNAGIIVVDNCSPDHEFEAGETILSTSGPAATIQVATPGRTGGLAYDATTRDLYLDPFSSYDFTSGTILGRGPVRVGDWIAVTDESTSPADVYGVFKIEEIIGPNQIKIHALGAGTFYGPTSLLPAESWNGGGGSEEYRYSWTVIDADLFDDIEKFFLAMDISDLDEHYAIWGFADYVEDPFTFPFLDWNIANYFFTIRRPLTQEEVDAAFRLVISDIPGGILYPNTPQGYIQVDDNQVHIGGASDVYLKPESSDDSFYTLPTVEDNDPVLDGDDLQWPVGDNELYSADFVNHPDLTGMVLVILEGEYVGSYRIVSHEQLTGQIRLDTVLTNAHSDIRYQVTDQIIVDLSDPRLDKIKYREDLNTSLSALVKAGTIGNYIDFEQEGVQEGDTLEILNGPDKGLHTVINILDGGETLELAFDLTWISSEIQFRIYRRLNSIPRPLVRVKKVDLMDEDGSDLGLQLPLRNPVDIRSGELSNAGLGEKIPNTLRTDPEVTTFVNVGGYGKMTDGDASFVTEGIVPGDVLSVDEGVNEGFYIVKEVIDATNLLIETEWENEITYIGAGPDYRIGAPSTGTFRLYFLEPTFFEVNEDTLFTDPANRQYRGDIFARSQVAAFTDPTADVVTAPSPPGITNKIESATVDFRLYEVQVGDRFLITTMAIDGDNTLGDSVNVSGSRLTLEFEGESARSVIFQGSNPIDLQKPGYPGGVKEQIEAEFPDLTIEISGTAPNKRLTFHSDREFWFRGGTAASALGVGVLLNTSNLHPQSGRYLVDDITTDGSIVTLKNLDGVTAPVLETKTRVRVVIERVRVQRVGPKAMGANRDDTNLYYFDVDIMSVRPGNEHNLVESTEMTVEGHRSFGYELVSRNIALTWGNAEELDLIVTPYIMDPLGTDTFVDLVMVPARELQFSVDTSATVGDVQGFLMSTFNRVVNNSPYAKHYQPAYVRFVVQYTGGSSESVVKDDLYTLIDNLPPTQSLSTYDVQGVMKGRGAATLENPLEILAIIHEMDRSVRTIRTTNRLSTPRTAHTISDRDSIRVVRLGS
jgi:hypothetical protein